MGCDWYNFTTKSGTGRVYESKTRPKNQDKAHGKEYWSLKPHKLCTEPQKQCVATVLLIGRKLKESGEGPLPAMPTEMWLAILQHLKLEELGVFTERFWFDASTKERSDDGGFIGTLNSEEYYYDDAEDSWDDSADGVPGVEKWLVVEIEKPMSRELSVPGPYCISEEQICVDVDGRRILVTSTTGFEGYI